MGVFSGVGGVPIAYAWTIPANAHSAIVLLNGRVETFLKYKDVIFDLFNNGFAVFTLDHRGQGLSGRMTADTQQGYVEHFDDYVDDALCFIQEHVIKYWHKPLSLMCHSMGGAIGTLALLREPHLFQSAVLCSPMFGIRPALPNTLANILIRAGLKKSQLKNKSSDYFFGQGRYRVHPFKLNVLTHSKVRYQSILSLYAEQKHLRLGGVTSQWLAAAYQAMDTIENNAERITCPMLVLSSGDDKVIDNKRQHRVVHQFQNAEYVVVDGAYHELLCESDSYRQYTLLKSMQFFTESFS
nr:alpha/beta fold hydrolase [Alteromonas sp. 5E99-2]